MDSKSTYLLDHHGSKVRELQSWIRIVKTTGVILIFSVLINFILMYGLIRYPCSPTPASCTPYCSISNSPRMSLVSRLIESSAQIPSSSSDNSAELAIRVAPKTEVKDLAIRASTDIAAHFDEREVYHWFVVAMAGYWVTNQAISWWNMVSACHDFSDASNVINCVWGAVTTCVTAAGALWGATKGIGKIQTWANNNGITFGGFKRDTVDAELLDAFSSVLNTPVTHLGVFDYAPLGLNGTFGKRESVEPIDVFGFTSPEGLDMHVSFLGLMDNMGGSGKKQVAFKFGLGSGLAPSGNNKRALFNEQYFTDGGIDFILDENPSDGAVLSTVYDYGQLNHEISCYMGGSSDAAGHYFQIYDNNHEGTIAGGSIAPFRGSDHWSAITQMYNEPFPIRLTPSCEMS